MKLTVDFLQKNFDKYNNLIFDGELPKIEIKVGRMTRRFGYYYRQTNRYTGRVIKEYIAISSFFVVSEKEYINTLVHEMLHYYIAFKNIKDSSSHGVIWTDYANEISRKYDLDIKAYGSKSVVKGVDTKSSFRIIVFECDGHLSCSKISAKFNVKNLEQRFGVKLVKEFTSSDTKYALMKTSVKNLHLYAV